MIINDEQRAILDQYWNNEISRAEFGEIYPDDLKEIERIKDLYEMVLKIEESDVLEEVFFLGSFYVGDRSALESVYIRLVKSDWHCWQEWFLKPVESIGSDNCVDAIYYMATTPYSLIDSDDRENLAVQCTYSLANIASKRAIERLQLLSKSDNERIKSEALMRLSEIGAV